MKIVIATDHNGVNEKEAIINNLKENYTIIDKSPNNTPTDDYPVYAIEVAKYVSENEDSLGILLCGTGIGMSIAANKVKGIRAARCVDVDDAFYAKNHNSANIICLSSNIELNYLFEIIDTFINTKSAEEEKHINRVNKIIKYEQGS